MVLLESLALELGMTMPRFTLKTPDGKVLSSEACHGSKGLLIAFTCNHCPYAIAIWERLIELANWAQPLGVNTVAINPNINPNYPADSPEEMLKKIKEWKIPFPYLVDETQEVAKAFQAQCTPDLYLLNADHELEYHGRLDDNWQEPEKVTQQELKAALSALTQGQPVSTTQYPSLGCSIKWNNA
jgi:peroxiredoxin